MIEKLFYTSKQGGYQQTDRLQVDESGIEGSKSFHSWRQLLLLSNQSLLDFDLKAGQLKENIVLDCPDNLYDLPSGTTVEIGDAQLRLTFHCEPCAKLKPVISPGKLTHRRGYLAQVIKAGHIRIGDTLSVLEKHFEAIPYSAADRIEWFLIKYPNAIFASELIEKVGLPKSYCRAIPQILCKYPAINAELILFKKNQ